MSLFLPMLQDLPLPSPVTDNPIHPMQSLDESGHLAVGLHHLTIAHTGQTIDKGNRNLRLPLFLVAFFLLLSQRIACYQLHGSSQVLHGLALYYLYPTAAPTTAPLLPWEKPHPCC